MPTEIDPLAVLARTDPAAGLLVPERPPLEELVSLPAGPAGSSGRGPRGRVLVLAAAGLLVVLLAGAALLFTAGDPESSPPATQPAVPLDDGAVGPAPLELAPGTPAGPELLALAEVAEADPTLVPEGSVAYSHVLSVGSETTSEDGGPPDVTYAPSHWETWIEPDGTLHRRTGDGPPVRTGAEIQIDPGLAPPEGDIGSEDVFEPGVLDRPTDPDVVRLDLVAQAAGGPEGRAALERLADILGRQPLGGTDRGALYRALATVDGIELRGEVRDRAGRTGLAFSATTATGDVRSETVVVVDPGTGAVLGAESVILESTGSIPIDGPLVQSYTVLLEVAAVPAAGERPA